MKKRLTRKRVLYTLAILLLVAAGIVFACRKYRTHRRLLFAYREWWHEREWRDRSVWLPDYKVVVDARPIDGIDDNLSALTWNGDTKTLFAVVNNPPLIVELSTAGELLRRIDLHGFEDPEAIEYIGDGHYIVADEQTQKIIRVAIDPRTAEIHAEGLQRLTLGMGPVGNKGLEGLAWDSDNRKLYAAKERNPVHIYEVTGFPHEPSTTLDIEVTGNRRRDDRLFLDDVSSLDFNRKHQHLLVLSDESRRIIEIDKQGHPVSSLSLAAGNGLRQPVPQAEGIAMDDEENLYIVSEPNLFYLFRKKAED